MPRFVKDHRSRVISFGALLSLSLINLAGYVTCQDNSITTVNILFIHQEMESERLFNATLSFFEKNRNHGIQIGEVHRFFANSTDAAKLTEQFCKKVDSFMKMENPPDIAIDFTRIGIPSEAVKVVLKVIQMPTISATFGQEGDIREWRDLTEEQLKYMIQVSPPADILIQSVRSLVDIQNMTSAVVLFDEQYEMYHKYKSLLQNMPTRHLLTKVEKMEKITGQITKLVHVDIVNFFIAATPDEISEVLARASDPNSKDGPYFSDEFAWYSMSLTDGFPRCNGCEMDVSLVHLSPDLKSDPKTDKRKNFLQSHLEQSMITLTEMFYLDISLDAIFAVADVKKQGKWTHNIRNNSCVAFELSKDEKKEMRYDPLNLDLLSAFEKAGEENILPFHIEANGKNYPKFNMKITRLSFHNKTAQPRVTETIGYWEAGFGESALIHFDDKKNLTAHVAHTVFRIVTVEQPPFVMRKKNCVEDLKNDKYKNCFYGYCIDLLEKIRTELSFNYTIRAVDSYGYMKEAPPHEWDGMVRELKDRKADIALGAMSVMAERETVVDFTVPYYDLVGISILMRKPKTTTSLFKFLTVLENDVWMCILGAYFFTSILMWIFDRWSPYSYQNNREKYEDDEEKREFNLKECLWFCMTSLTPQGGGEAPKNLSGRLVAATWWLFGFIIIASYTANLAAFLTVSRLDAPIESLEDLSKQYKIQYAPLQNSSAWIYFDRMAHIEHRFYEIWKDMSLNDSMNDYERSQLAVWDYPVSDRFTKMWQAMQENNPPGTFEDAVDRVRGINKDDPKKEADGFAFLGDATDIRYQVLTSCDLQMVGEEFSRKPYALAVQQGSPLKDQLNDAILKLLNQRYLEQLKEIWWNENPQKVDCPRDDNQSDGISIHNIGGVFIVIFVGIVMACFTLIFEYWWYRKRNVSEEIAEMNLPPPKEFGSTFNTEKTNFNTQYDKPPSVQLPSIENSW